MGPHPVFMGMESDMEGPVSHYFDGWLSRGIAGRVSYNAIVHKLLFGNAYMTETSFHHLHTQYLVGCGLPHQLFSGCFQKVPKVRRGAPYLMVSSQQHHTPGFCKRLGF